MLSLKQGWAQIPGCWTFQLVLATEAPVPAAGTRYRRLGWAALPGEPSLAGALGSTAAVLRPIGTSLWECYLLVEFWFVILTKFIATVHSFPIKCCP